MRDHAEAEAVPPPPPPRHPHEQSGDTFACWLSILSILFYIHLLLMQWPEGWHASSLIGRRRSLLLPPLPRLKRQRRFAVPLQPLPNTLLVG